MLISEYISFLTVDKSQSTIKTYKRNVTEFINWLSVYYNLNESTKAKLEHINRYQHYLLNEKKFKVAGVLLRMNSIISYYKFLYMQNYTVGDITKGFSFIRKDKGDISFKTASRNDISKYKQEVYKGNNYRDIAIIEVLANTGIKPSEMITLTLNEVELVEGKYYFKVKNERLEQTKVIPLNSYASKALGKYFENCWEKIYESNKLWVGQRGALTQDGLNKLINRYAKRCGLEGKINPTMFREYLISNLINEENTDSALVSMFLGNSTDSSVKRYVLKKQATIADSLEAIYVSA